MTVQVSPNSLDNYWMPFTANRDFRQDPRLLVRAEGVSFWNHRGDRLLDACSGLFCVPLGHGRREITEAVATQLATLDFAPPFQYGTPGAFELARRVAALTPNGLDHVFFTNSGSESVETAMKIALAYHRANGEPQRQRFIGRERGYHGVNFGGISVGGMVKNREAFGSALPVVSHLRHTHLDANRMTPGQGAHGADLADDLQRFVDLHGATSIAACIVEPVAGSTGVLVPPKGYLERLRAICDRHGILLIFDEVITGFGRLGPAFGAQAFGVTPDIMTMAKALTNGAIPMGAAVFRNEIHDTIVNSAPAGTIELFHGYTYSAHPAACAAGNATLALYESEGTFAQGAALAPYFQEQLFALADLPVVRDIRGLGLLGGIDLAQGEGPGTRGYETLKRLFAAGLVTRVTADTLILAPAFVMARDDVDRLFETLRDVLGTI
ncbi:aspartate aminotransferase family protein [Oceanibacterium hippocampi]|uniref:Omega-amino acid--pyruvate aminotransferase n=1 Tax=Oceanibacterium hippocampi TaxID=745714 RepID=A0A1Y5U1H9_9PROT|nr:aspartate aminotransferase family protein [Oceanibacterium hippocampi]SLN76271.1 Omega-amino acid--pyruvate aminotransferase [Oceanibacterium hippocampi]